ncbi:MAG: hypothetical protein AB7G28_01180 [Pirellulales bacterium]
MRNGSPGKKSIGHVRGLGQLTLVEHALCPLSTTTSPSVPMAQQGTFKFVDTAGNRQIATTSLTAPFGLRPSDELFLWGMLGLTFAQPEPSLEFCATPHFVLKQLGCINTHSDRGGSAYRMFRSALRRLSAVNYWCSAFYDPLRREHRETSFGFLSYSLPFDPASSRAWRILWDPIFFEYCRGAGGSLAFDMPVYRALDPAARRLYLFISKIFWRREWTHWLDLQSLAIDVLGFSPHVALRNLKQKVKRAVLRLAEHGIVNIPRHVATRDLFITREDGSCILRLRRGPSFRKNRSDAARESLAALSIYEPLRAIGLDDAAVGWVAKNFRHGLVQQWADVTLAAQERHGASFFKKSPQAYLIDNLREAAAGGRTPPDWWWAHKREEEQRAESPAAEELLRQIGLSSQPKASKPQGQSLTEYLQGEGRETYVGLVQQLSADLRREGLTPSQAHRKAIQLCVQHFQRRFLTS